MGAAVAWQVARLGASVVGIDRYEPPHSLGSSHAETRITRLAVAEGDQYLPFVARSHDIWREIEALTCTRLLHESGGYIVSSAGSASERWSDFTQATADVAQRHGIDYELLSAAAACAAHPQVAFADEMAIGFEPTAGVVMSDDAVRAQLQLAADAGARVETQCAVTAIEPVDDLVHVTTSSGEITARHVVLAAGAWLPDLVPQPVADQLTVTRQVVYWFEVDDLEAYRPERLPFVMWIEETIEGYCAIFPAPTGAIPAVKILGEQFADETTANDVTRTVSDDEIADFHRRLVAPRFPGVSNRCLKAEVCLYTNTSDDHFLIQSDPRSERITIMSPCSGHGFKHSAALGEAVAQHIVHGASTLDLSPFGL